MLICCCTPPPPPPPSPSPDDCEGGCSVCAAFDPDIAIAGYTLIIPISGLTGAYACANGSYTLTWVSGFVFEYSGPGFACATDGSEDVLLRLTCSGRPCGTAIFLFEINLNQMNYFCPVEIVDPPDTIIGEWHGTGQTDGFGSTEGGTFSVTVVPP